MHARFVLCLLASATPMISIADVLPTVQGSSADAQPMYELKHCKLETKNNLK